MIECVILIYAVKGQLFYLGYITGLTTGNVRAKERKFISSYYYFISEIHKEKTGF